jgi:hypothetical protein
MLDGFGISFIAWLARPLDLPPISSYPPTLIKAKNDSDLIVSLLVASGEYTAEVLYKRVFVTRLLYEVARKEHMAMPRVLAVLYCHDA